MAAISVGEAVGAGFSLIGRRFVAVMGWGFFAQLAVLILFVLGVLIVGLPMVMQSAGAFRNAETDPEAARQMITALMISIWPALALVIVGSLFINAVVQGAAIRAVLWPDQRGFLSMRFGRSEAALVLLYLLMFLVMLLVVIVTAVVWGGVFFAGAKIGGFGGGFLAFIVCVAYLFGLMWLGCRFALAAPATVAEGGVRFFTSWTLTRGHGWATFGLAWLMILIFFGVFFAYMIISLIISAVFGAGAGAAILAAGGGKSPGDMAQAWPILLLTYIPSIIVGAIYTGVTNALSMGPWADLYRQLKGPPDVAATFT